MLQYFVYVWRGVSVWICSGRELWGLSSPTWMKCLGSDFKLQKFMDNLQNPSIKSHVGVGCSLVSRKEGTFMCLCLEAYCLLLCCSNVFTRNPKMFLCGKAVWGYPCGRFEEIQSFYSEFSNVCWAIVEDVKERMLLFEMLRLLIISKCDHFMNFDRREKGLFFRTQNTERKKKYISTVNGKWPEPA